MDLISLPDACHALNVNMTTLYRWLKRADMKPNQDEHEYDQRKRYITANQLQTLAYQHNKQLPEMYHALATSVESLEASEQEKRLMTLAKSLEALELRLSRIEGLLEGLSKVPKHVAPVKEEYKLSEVKNIPEGSLLMREFARRHNLKRDWLQLRIDRGEVPAISIPYREGKQYWFSHEQQKAVLAYMRGKGVQFGECEDLSCPCHEK